MITRVCSQTLKAAALLQAVRGKKISLEERIEKTFELATYLLDATLSEKTRSEKKREARLAKMVEDPNGRTFLTALADRSFRSRSVEKTVDQMVYLIKKYGLPQFLSENDRVKFLALRFLGPLFPSYFVPLVRKKMRGELSSVLLPEGEAEQRSYFEKSRQENIRINLNHLGEAILGEQEAIARLNVYLQDLANPMIEYISIKISTIYSQINMIDIANSLEVLAERLRLLYRAALKHQYNPKEGPNRFKFVNLDMEEYKDLDLTVDLFQKVLSEEKFKALHAGIVLQSYLPDSFEIQKKLTEWAKKRVQEGGAPIKIRIVKGANLSMEVVESSLRRWPQAPFDQKSETDANFRRMLEYGSLLENAKAVHIGVGSHNLFDIAYALLLRSENKAEESINFEMLEGMAEPLRRTVQKITKEILIYCPEAKEKDFQNAVAYLIRRLDENSGEENFLRHFFSLKPGNLGWEEEKRRFKEGCFRISSLTTQRRRLQNRFNQEKSEPKHFENEPDTDFSLKENRKWADEIFSSWENKKHPTIPIVIAQEELTTILEPGYDPSRPGAPRYNYSLADLPLVEKALNCAENNQEKWGALPFKERSCLLAKVAQIFRERRKDLIGAMIADCGKTVAEADPEVSEAIDFIEYYRENWESHLQFADLRWSPKGNILVAPPWNFPCSIPVSGIAAALTAGNCVLFKPAPEAVLVGWEVAKAFWEGGIPREVLQFINCKEEPVGSYLIKHPKISAVILTGSAQTALKFLNMRPGIDLHAETGGKNAIIVTALCDRDLAVRDLVSSAFGFSGQKCSACSLAILEAEVYDDPHFKKQLLDAAQSLKVASAWEKGAKIIPLIHPPEEALLRGLTRLDEGESWLLEPRQNPKNPSLWSPGIKWGVKEGSFTHQTELFGPVLAVMRAENLDDAIRLANGTPYGLTSGLHSLDERQHAYWISKIQAGNLYINRGITGAIVRRQPFGGCKASSFGTGAKAGGPNYVSQFAKATQVDFPKEAAPLPSSLIPLITALWSFNLEQKEHEIWKKSAENYAYWGEILKKPTDFSPVVGQDNYFYHIPLQRAYARFDNVKQILPLLQVAAACLICSTPLEISSAEPLPILSTIPGLSVLVEGELDFLKRRNPSHIRLFAPPTDNLKNEAAERGIILQSEPVLMNGHFELLHYLREISLSIDYHRYGFLAFHRDYRYWFLDSS